MRFKYPMHKFVVIDGRAKVSPRMANSGDERSLHHFDLLRDLNPDTDSIDWERSAMGWIVSSGGEREVALQQEITPETETLVRDALAGWCRRHRVAQLQFVASPYVTTEDSGGSGSALAENLRRLLGMHELSLVETGMLVGGLSAQAISLLVTERRGPSALMLSRLGELFEIAPARLKDAPFVELLAKELADKERFLRVEARIEAARRESTEGPKRPRQKGRRSVGRSSHGDSSGRRRGR
jgi:hypothetical protein